jgi:gatB/yqey domain protein
MFEKIQKDYIQAMKNKETLKKSALNYLIAQIKNKKIELQRDPNDEEIISVIKKEVKSLNEAISFLEKANKPEELQEEKEKKLILESYLPATLDEEQTKALIVATISKLNITDLKTQRGLLMKELMATHKAELDTALLNSLINTML